MSSIPTDRDLCRYGRAPELTECIAFFAPIIGAAVILQRDSHIAAASLSPDGTILIS
jgi:hypothetical protein